MSKIIDVHAREVLDSRGNPTVEVEVTLDTLDVGTSIVPSGKSTGIREALELRDNGSRYNGMGVLKAVLNVNTVIREALLGQDVLNQKNIDDIMIKLDGTSNKRKLGANAILGVSMACFKAASRFNKMPIYKYAGTGRNLPILMINILNGGVHADNNIDFQEYMIIPQASLVSERIRIGVEVFNSFREVLKNKGYNTNVGDEGGFSPNLSNNSIGLELIVDAIEKASYKPGIDVFIGLDVAASTFCKDGFYYLNNNQLSREELIDYYNLLISKYPIVSIEDPLVEDDWEGYKLITQLLGNRIQIVGDDLFVTNKKYLKKGIKNKCCNSILLKLNQIGTITEFIETLELARDNNYKTIISHRSGETEDTLIADLSVGLNIGQIKTGSMSRTDRICKYNQLLRIEEYILKNSNIMK